MKNQLMTLGFGFLLLSIPLLAQQPRNPAVDLSAARGIDPTALLTAPEREDAVSPQEVQVDEFPRPLKKAEPWYPELAQKAGIEGTVYVQISVDTTGNVTEAKVVKTDHEVLNEAALQAARQWTFTPAMKDKKKLAIVLTIPFRFKLAGKKEGNAVKEKEAYALPKMVQALLKGDAGTDTRECIAHDAYLIDGNLQVNLMEAINGSSKTTVFSAERSRSVGSIRMNMNDEGTAAYVVAMTEGENKSAPRWHTVVWKKGGEGKWKIQHWHTSR